MPSTEYKIDTPCKAYYEMDSHWVLIRDLLGGTSAMRDAGTTWLPQEPEEKDAAYEVRKLRSFLYSAYEDTIDRIIAKPFSKPVVIQGEIPEPLDHLQYNTDNEGSDITSFSKERLRTGLNYGLTHILVEYPAVRYSEDMPGPSRAEEGQLRPYFVEISPDSLLGWRWDRAKSNEKILTQIRFKESAIEPEGTWGEQEIDYIRVIDSIEGRWYRYRKTKEDKEYAPYDEGVYAFPGDGIPLRTLYTGRTGYMTGLPALNKLAWKNLEHWQKSSDYSNYIHFAGIGIIFVKGISDMEKKQQIVISVNNSIKVTNPDADMKIVEHTGQAANIQRQALQDIIDQMQVMGLQPFLKRTGNQTATGQAIDESKHINDVQAWVRETERVLEQCYYDAATWKGLDLPDDFKIDIYSDFGISLRAQEDIKALLMARESKNIDHETFLKEIKRRGLLSDDVDIEEVMGKIETEGPDMSTFGAPPEMLQEKELEDATV